MNDPSASSGSNATAGSCSTSTPSKLSTVDILVLEGCIDDVLSSLTEKGLRCKLLESGTKLRDIVEPVASDFSKLFESISEGAKIISDQKYSCSKLSSEAQSVALDTVKQLGNVHWAAIGLLAIANVLERFDKISTNDRDCLDLLKLMLDLAKFLKQLKEMNADSHNEMSEKMNEALHLIVSGAILCRSFIAYKKMLKFLFTTKIRDELVYVRRKLDSIIGQLSLQMQVKVASFYMSQQQPCPNPGEPGGLPSEQSMATNEIVQCEMEHSSEKEICEEHTNVVSRVNEWKIEEAVSCESSNWGDRPQNSKKILATLVKFPKYLKKLTERRSPSQRKQKRGKKVVLGIRLDIRQLSSFSIEDDSGGLTIHFSLNELKKATNKFRHPLESYSSWCNLFKGTLSSGRQVVVRTFPKQQASSSEENSMKTMVNELVCMVNLRHKNIAKLVGFCNIGKEELMLVYDYLPNRRLSDFLYGGNLEQNKILDWSERLKIILGVISALFYLHGGVQENMYCVHRDIKPENILLDDNFNAKLSGFDLAEFIPFDDFGFGRPPAGTPGYVAPECFEGRLTNKSDIYSFGILVLAIVSGKRPFDLEAALADDDDVMLTDPAMGFYKENRLADLSHPELSSIKRCIRIARWCVLKYPSLRPTTQRVSTMFSTEDEIPPLPEDNNFSMEPHSSEQSGCSSVQSRKGRQSEGEIEEIEDLPRDWKAFD